MKLALPAARVFDQISGPPDSRSLWEAPMIRRVLRPTTEVGCGEPGAPPAAKHLIEVMRCL